MSRFRHYRNLAQTESRLQRLLTEFRFGPAIDVLGAAVDGKLDLNGQPIKGDSDVALLTAMLHVIVEEGLADERFIADRTLGFEALREHVRGCSPELAEPLRRVAQEAREVAVGAAGGGNRRGQ